MFNKKGVTLIEVLVVVSLVGLVFGIGIYPIMSQLRLTRAERREISLFDEANLVANYITKDAMRASRASEYNFFGIIGLHLWVNKEPPKWYNEQMLKDEVYYLWYSTTRLYRWTRSQNNDGTYTAWSNTIITAKLNPAIAPVFKLDPNFNAADPQNDFHRYHQVRCELHFQDPDDSTITTDRIFEVMLRGRDTAKP